MHAVSFVAGSGSARMGAPPGGGGSGAGDSRRIISEVNCDSRRIISEVNGLEVSVSANQLHELCIVAIVEHADAAIGRCHLLKRSLLLFRAWARHDALRSNAETMAFGVGDLVISGDLSACASELERSYGAGLRADEAQTLLAGAPTFAIDALELWAVLPQA